jgi:hypothetical protein
VRIRTTDSAGITHTLSSPILPVAADLVESEGLDDGDDLMTVTISFMGSDGSF